MGLVVNTNMMSLNLLNDMNKNIKKTQKASEKLASGFKINRAGDDSSGLAVSEKMRNKIAALDVQLDTDEDAVNLLQTADGYMAEVQSMVERMVELTMKSTNGILSDHPDRDNLQKEMDQLCGEIDRIATTANFNGIKLLSGAETQKVAHSYLVTVAQAIPGSNLLKDADTFTGPIIDGMDINQTVEHLANIASEYVSSHGRRNEAVNNMAVYYGADGTPAIVASKDANIGDLKAQLQMDPGDTLNKVETSNFNNVDHYYLDIPDTSFVDNDDDGTQTVALLGAALEAYKAGFEDLNCMKGQRVYYTTDGQFAVVKPSETSSIDIQSEFAGMGATTPVSCKSLPVLISYEEPKSFKIPVGVTATKYEDRKIPLDLKIGESSTIPDKLELELYDFHTDHLFEPDYMDVITGSKTVQQTVTSSGTRPHATIGGTKNSQNENAYSGAPGSSHQIITTVPIYSRVNVGAETKTNNDVSTYRKATSPDISTQDKANSNIDVIKKVSDKISAMRGDYGAKQNRIERTINVITTESENTKAAKSRIQDTDMAVQISQYTSQNIMTQAAQSLFAQANAKPQEVTSLLQG